MNSIYKFGGSSLKNAANIKLVTKIISENKEDDMVIVFSAMGKVTNMLEEVVNSYFNKQKKVRNLLKKVRDFHVSLANQLFNKNDKVFDEINNLIVEIEWVIDDDPTDNYSYYYDQIVAIGELLSTKIMSAFLHKNDIINHWTDIRDIVRTDDSYRNAKIHWNDTMRFACKNLKSGIVVTQGFIGSTSENNTTTLGREGSDFTAAILAYCLNAKKVIIWKDVPGLMNADPAIFDQTQLFTHISYDEAIELAFFGAKVIHPKTIQPLKKKLIPLQIKSFYNSNEKGTIISKISNQNIDVESYIVKENQILISISARDLTFIVENHISQIFSILSKNLVEVNLMQNSAVSFSVCVDNDKFKIPKTINELKSFFRVVYNDNLILYTIKNYNKRSLEKLINKNNIILQQKSRTTVQLIAQV
tara:strand:- start:1854 stop:3104 length:1251 start_codon:yes stop_codon:yes gene_type:complete